MNVGLDIGAAVTAVARLDASGTPRSWGVPVATDPDLAAALRRALTGEERLPGTAAATLRRLLPQDVDQLVLAVPVGWPDEWPTDPGRLARIREDLASDLDLPLSRAVAAPVAATVWLRHDRPADPLTAIVCDLGPAGAALTVCVAHAARVSVAEHTPVPADPAWATALADAVRVALTDPARRSRAEQVLAAAAEDAGFREAPLLNDVTAGALLDGLRPVIDRVTAELTRIRAWYGPSLVPVWTGAADLSPVRAALASDAPEGNRAVGYGAALMAGDVAQPGDYIPYAVALLVHRIAAGRLVGEEVPLAAPDTVGRQAGTWLARDRRDEPLVVRVDDEAVDGEAADGLPVVLRRPGGERVRVAPATVAPGDYHIGLAMEPDGTPTLILATPPTNEIRLPLTPDSGAGGAG